ncbi:MAG TPA: hypothetical protein VF690_13690, partial [Hymenobacter sp.]
IKVCSPTRQPRIINFFSSYFPYTGKALRRYLKKVPTKRSSARAYCEITGCRTGPWTASGQGWHSHTPTHVENPARTTDKIQASSLGLA